MNDKAIIVWAFEDAPVELQKLSTNGGDEDWLAEIPPSFGSNWIGWMAEAILSRIR